MIGFIVITSEAKQSIGIPNRGWIAASPAAPRNDGREFIHRVLNENR